MRWAASELDIGILKLNFDRRLMLQVRGSATAFYAGLIAGCELDGVLGLTMMASDVPTDARTGTNGRHVLAGMFRQPVFGRLADHEHVSDAERLRHDPAMRWVGDGKAASGAATSPSRLGRFETRWLAPEKNLSVLTDLSGKWIDRVHRRNPPKAIDLDNAAIAGHGGDMNSFLRTAVAWVFGVAVLAPAALEAGTRTVVTADAVIVKKSEREMRLLRGGAVIATIPVGLGSNPQGDKVQQGDGRTPEGDYVLDWRNPQSRFHRSIHISYPNAADRAQAAARGVSPGGGIFIHGTPWLDNVAGFDWTNGCIAVTNADMDVIWAMVPDGTPITIQP
jgi:hypothetical protein